ncbi:hypothetical protein GT204_05135 [Streptomyces sp. SID4919]|uniref:hypothetical protein n=1 Tax=unclassified Streptomyces TaxID=2593676 RepID=UPI000823ED60|nr:MULTISPECIES: hypothetical protein [unclassified Streptomyces]MYY08305.1 hypothetical protein [Streptomyces sp. SID4919]SCK59327.1 hypothetical protein YW7DRAFT_05712 [Streptomyces sp. AmelKG-E11A]
MDAVLSRGLRSVRGPALALISAAVLPVVLTLSAPAAAAEAAPAAARAAPVAVTATDIAVVADALRESPVYVDPAASGRLSTADADALTKKIVDAGKPLFVAVLPADFPTKDLFTDLRTDTGITGVYAVRLGDRFDAHADSAVMSRTAVGNLVRSVEGDASASAQLNDFVDRALPTARGSAPASWGGDPGSSFPTGTVIGVGTLVVLGGAGLYAVSRRNRRRHEEEQRAALDKLRVVVDEDITAFGEELDRLDFHPAEAGADDAMRGDYEHALDAYEKAKSSMAAARRPEDVRPVTGALEDGRFSLAVLAARRAGRPVPERRGPCFFDPRHGPSTEDVRWAPAGGAEREVPVCAADAARLREGAEPMIREVDTEHGRRPYYDAGPAYGPWAGGYFAAGLLPTLLVGTMLGGMMASPAYAADYGSGYGDFGPGAGYDGGDVSGADFSPDDFGGGGFGDGGGDFGGGGGGGDFGGGF